MHADDGSSTPRLSTASLARDIKLIQESPRDKGQRLTSDTVELVRDPLSPPTAQGTYFVKNRKTGKQVGVFKPAAEEAAMQIRRKMSIHAVIKRVSTRCIAPPSASTDARVC